LKFQLPENRSAFLWGPRKCGKTSLLRRLYGQQSWIDLLDYDLFTRLNRRPKLLRELFASTRSASPVVIDEVQKIPHLMDEIHWLIENRGIQFILSGSSARKMIRSGSGLLGGRAWRFELFPLVTAEIGTGFDLDRALYSGFIPNHFLSPDPLMDLKAYAMDYLKEEIQAEALTRNLPAFSSFLHSAALTSGMLLNYSNCAREAGVAVKTIREYYQILEDTLIGYTVPPWKKARSRRLIGTAKFYFFDPGIVNGLLRPGPLIPGTSEYGRAFEHFIIQECRTYRSYSRRDFPIQFWRTASGAEVDLILGEAETAIEIKSSSQVSGKTRGLHLFHQEFTCKKRFIVSKDPMPRSLESGVTILPWQDFCSRLWQGEII
jgi:uncharacterized protein